MVLLINVAYRFIYFSFIMYAIDKIKYGFHGRMYVFSFSGLVIINRASHEKEMETREL